MERSEEMATLPQEVGHWMMREAYSIRKKDNFLPVPDEDGLAVAAGATATETAAATAAVLDFVGLEIITSFLTCLNGLHEPSSTNWMSLQS
jgi:hypothetical protein